MNASWSMVLGALLAGTVGGFMIPVRPEIRDVPALTASKVTEPAKASAAAKSAADKSEGGVRQIPLTEAASRQPEPAAQAKDNDRVDKGCAKETWPYRSSNCLDRTAKVAPADTVVAARRVDPAVSLQDTESQKATADASSAQKSTTTARAAEAPASKPEPAKTEQKVVTARPAREERTERPAPQPEQASRPASEPRAEANERREVSNGQPRRPARRANRNAPDFDDGIPTRIYLRGPDGRLYLAPEYRPSGRTVYYMR